MGVAQDLQRHLVGDRGVQLEQGEDRQNDGQDLIAAGREDFILRFAVNLIQLDLFRRDLLLFLEQHIRDSLVVGLGTGRTETSCLFGMCVKLR